ncbi:hypothetical protein KGQ27_00280 [Patescibacteria group bacterium]|nr:hypothetical protein [Patescibacteria group bacterium]MDE1946653.1 hypothetical protein [Patescibacteria group bacterium]MDE2010606.1 hypothetical protein [Patescibacteria group bacterium]MDE2232947.1 hypothetical protein [Patescibacteria group bacterium]
MVSFYSRRQTIFVFVASAAIVIGVAAYVNSGQIGSADAQSRPDLAASAHYDYKISADNSSANWQKEFFDSGTTTAPSTGKTINYRSSVSNTNNRAVLTDTDRLGRDFFSRYTMLKQAGLDTNSDMISQAMANTVNSSFNDSPPKTYTADDLRITGATDAASVQAFSNALVGIINSYDVTKNESAVVQEYLTNNDPSVLGGIDPIVVAYKRIVSELLNVPVPQELSSQDAALINAFATLEFAAEQLRSLAADPVKGLAGVSAHPKGIQDLVDALKGMTDSLKVHGVSFDFNQDIMNTLIQ